MDNAADTGSTDGTAPSGIPAPNRKMVYPPVPMPFFILNGLVVLALIVYIVFYLMSRAFGNLGLSGWAVAGFLLVSLLGSAINIPLKRIKCKECDLYSSRIEPFLRTNIPVPEHDPYVTNICFAGAGSRTAWVTSSGRGVLYTLEWDGPGLDLAYTA